MSKPIEALMQREMSRKEFLVTLGFGIASVLGFANVIHMLTGKSLNKHLDRPSGFGYGGSAYGGGRD